MTAMTINSQRHPDDAAADALVLSASSDHSERSEKTHTTASTTSTNGSMSCASESASRKRSRHHSTKSDINSTTSGSTHVKHKRSVPMTLLELMGRNTPHNKVNNNKKQESSSNNTNKLKSCLKKGQQQQPEEDGTQQDENVRSKRNSSLNETKRRGDSMTSKKKSNHSKKSSKQQTRKSKRVQFAVSHKSNKVWALTKEFQKVPERLHKDLWWSSDDMQDRYEQDEDLLEDSSLVPDAYVHAVEVVFAGTACDCEEAKECWETILGHNLSLQQTHKRELTTVRGLEGELSSSHRTKSIRNHCRAVLSAQAWIQQQSLRCQDDDDDDDDDDEDDDERNGNNDNRQPTTWMSDTSLTVLRKQSERFSHQSGLVAAKFGELDHEQSCQP